MERDNKPGHNHEDHITIIVNQVSHHISSSTVTAAYLRELAGAGADYEVWKVIKSPDPEGQLPVDDMQVKDSIEVKSGDKFRVVPPGTFGTVATLPAGQLSRELEQLHEQGCETEVHEDSSLTIVIFKKFPLPKGYNMEATDVLIKVPLSYPNGQLDMFWTEPNLRLASANGQTATSVEQILGRQWLRFSWHPQKWNPGRDNILTFVEFINRRLAQLK